MAGTQLASFALMLALLSGSPVTAKTAGPRDLAGMTTAELRDRLSSGCPVALVYNGGIDETGPHVALGKHNFRAAAYGSEIARRLNDAILVPIVPFAPNPPTVPQLPGQIALRMTTFLAVNEDLVRSLAAGGFRRIAILADHGMGLDDLRALAARLDAEFRPHGTRIFYIGDVYALAREQIEQEIKESGHVAGGHGGLWDTSETMAVDPTAVRPNLFALGTTEEDGNGEPNAEGFSGDPRGSTVALGRRFGERRIGLAVNEIEANLKSSGACP